MPYKYIDPDDYPSDIEQFLNEWFYDLPNVMLFEPTHGYGYRANYMGQDTYILFDDGLCGAAVYTNPDAEDDEIVLCICPSKDRSSHDYSRFVFDDDEDRYIHTYTQSELDSIITSYFDDIAMSYPTDWHSVIESVLDNAYRHREPFGCVEDVLAFMDGAEIYPFNEDCQKASVATKQIKWLN